MKQPKRPTRRDKKKEYGTPESFYKAKEEKRQEEILKAVATPEDLIK